MDKPETSQIINLYESHLQVEKLVTPGTARLYLNAVQMFLVFCAKYEQKLALPEFWQIETLGIRELEAFLQHQINTQQWQRSTLVTGLSGIRGFFEFLFATQYLEHNPVRHFTLPRDLTEIGCQKISKEQIIPLFQHDPPKTLEGLQQRLLLEFLYGLGLRFSKLLQISGAVPEPENKRIRLNFQNSKFKYYPFTPSALSIMTSYLKLIDEDKEQNIFWKNAHGKNMNAGQLQNLLQKFLIAQKLPPLSANALRDLSIQHFSEAGADIRSLQTLREVKQLRRMQSLKPANFSRLQNSFRKTHLRNSDHPESETKQLVNK